MYDELLTEIGLTKSEVAVYFALLEIGSSTTGPIIKKSGIASGKAYLILDKLIKKGLATFVIKSGIKYYQAKDPDRLLDYMKEKESELKEKEERLRQIIPGLRARYDEMKERQTAEIYEGTKAFRTFYELILKELKKGDTFYVMGASRNLLEKFNRYFLDWNKRRVKKGIFMKIIYNHDCMDIGKSREKMRLTEVRYMKKELETPSWIVIFGDSVTTLNVHDIPVCFLIRGNETAESYRKYFDIIWKQAAKP